MKREIVVTAYGELGNNASIHIPGRKSPASAIQKDTLQSVIEDLYSARSLLTTGKLIDAEEELDGVIDKLSDIYKCLLFETQDDFPLD